MLVRRATPLSADRPFLICLGIFIVFGLVTLTSASAPIGFSKFNDAYFFIKRQVFYGLLPGALVFLFLAKIQYGLWQKYAWLIYGATLFLLILVFVPGVGTVINGSRSWLHILNFNLHSVKG